MARLDWSDKAGFVIVAIVALVLGYRLYMAGKDVGAIALLGAASSLISGYWAQVSAAAAREAALLAPPPVPPALTRPLP